MDVITLATRLRIRQDSAYALVESGKIPAVKINGRWEISEGAVEERLRQRSKKRRPQNTNAPSGKLEASNPNLGKSD